ncbi:hypothetical protein NDU88_006384 [Pleurodeles waltl]|uniref:Uncharacterized protein n=1 Tax=Pleurodeles waltl TaxID=8319 RepID=A0AAV7UKU1_PLEWA|nr:hypothetical protein NDU88_006384 [Pleurodeles waltl]
MRTDPGPPLPSARSRWRNLGPGLTHSLLFSALPGLHRDIRLSQSPFLSRQGWGGRKEEQRGTPKSLLPRRPVGHLPGHNGHPLSSPTLRAFQAMSEPGFPAWAANLWTDRGALAWLLLLSLLPLEFRRVSSNSQGLS